MAILAPSVRRVKTGFWQWPSLIVMRLLLASYLRSNWYWGEFVILVGAFVALFFPQQVNQALFFGAGGSILYFLAILGAAIMTRHSFGARAYVVLARLQSRSAYVRGLMLATALLRLPLFVILLVLALSFQRIKEPDAGYLLVGSIGMLANCFLLSVLTVALSSPMATRLIRIVFLGWLLAAVSPLDKVADFLTLVRLPILPPASCFSLGVTGAFEWFHVLALLLQILYLVGLAWLAGFWLERRELLLQ